MLILGAREIFRSGSRMITGFLRLRFRFDCWSLFDTFFGFLFRYSVFCNLESGSSCLVSSLYFASLFFLCCGYFSLLGCYYILHTIIYIHTRTQTDLPSALFPLFIRWLRFFLLFCSFFCTASPVHTHFPCLSILFLSNMLLADTLFSSRLPLLAELYFLVFVWISSPISHQHMICQTIAVAFTGVYLLSSV